MKKYICFFNNYEFVTKYDIASRHITASDNINDSLLFEHEGSASYIAEKFGCYYREIEVEE